MPCANLHYAKLMLQARVTERPFFNPPRRRATPPGSVLMTAPASPLLDHCPRALPAAAYLSRRLVRPRAGRDLAAALDLCRPAGRPGPRHDAAAVTVGGAGGILLPHRRRRRHAPFTTPAATAAPSLCQRPQRLGRVDHLPLPRLGLRRDDGRLVSTAFATPDRRFRPRRPWAAAGGAAGSGTASSSCRWPRRRRTSPPTSALDALDNWPMDRLVTGHRIEPRYLACNWKVFWENYNECLHCPGIHPELCRHGAGLWPGHHGGERGAGLDPRGRRRAQR